MKHSGSPEVSSGHFFVTKKPLLRTRTRSTVYLARRDAKCLYPVQSAVKAFRQYFAQWEWGLPSCVVHWLFGSRFGRCMRSVMLFSVFVHCMFYYLYFICCTQLFMHREYIDTADGRCKFLGPFPGQMYHIDSDLSRVEHFALFRLLTTPTSASFAALEDSVDLAGGRFKCKAPRAGEGKWTSDHAQWN